MLVHGACTCSNGCVSVLCWAKTLKDANLFELHEDNEDQGKRFQHSF